MTENTKFRASLCFRSNLEIITDAPERLSIPYVGNMHIDGPDLIVVELSADELLHPTESRQIEMPANLEQRVADALDVALKLASGLQSGALNVDAMAEMALANPGAFDIGGNLPAETIAAFADKGLTLRSGFQPTGSAEATAD